MVSLNKAQKRLHVDKLQQQTHRLILRIAEKIGKEAKKQQALGYLRAADDCINGRRFDAAHVHCQEARDALVKAGALQEHEGRVMAVEARISQLAALASLYSKIEQAMHMANSALDLVRVPGKRDVKLEEARVHVANGLALHEALLDVHPSTVASVVGQIVSAGQKLSAELENFQTRLAEEEEWARECVAGQEAMQLAQEAQQNGKLDQALQYAETALKHFSRAEAEEGKQRATGMIEHLSKDHHRACAQVVLGFTFSINPFPRIHRLGSILS